MARTGENVLIRFKQGGATLELDSGALIDMLSGANINLAGANGIQVNSGGEISVKSGGSIDLLAGALFEIAGVDIRAELAAAVATPVAGVAAGYMVARGIFTPTDGSEDVVTGLTTVVAAVSTLVATPTLTHMWSQATIGDQAGAPAAGSIRVVNRKPTGVADVTPVDATTPWGDVAWIAVGV